MSVVGIDASPRSKSGRVAVAGHPGNPFTRIADRIWPSAAAVEGTTSRYLPGLDGLRAIAVLAVLFFHSAPGIPAGGFLGVEVFFVISGFIITRGLLTERGRSGSIGMWAFWGRRARRLLPALFLLLAAVVVYSAAFERSTLAALREDVVAALLYVTNWHLIISGQPYFETFTRPSLLRHLWSLAVEEQFYVVWPLIMVGGLALFGRRALFALIVAGAIASAVAMALMYENGASVSRVYYGTDTRAAGLLIGAALAFVWTPGVVETVSRRNRLIPLDILGLAAVAVLAWLFFWLHDDNPFLYRGGFFVCGIATAGLIAAVVNRRSASARLFGVQPLPWIGLRSYAIYLWHWPVLMLTRPGEDIPLDAWAALPLQLALILALADASYRFVEVPIRDGALRRFWSSLRGWRSHTPRRRALIGAGGFASLGAFLVLAGVVGAAHPPQVPEYFNTESVRITSSMNGPGGGQVAAAGTERATNTPTPTNTPEPSPTPTATLEPVQEVATATPTAPPPTPTPSPTPVPTTPPPPPPPAQAPRVTAIGDSVMLGAAGALANSVAGIDIDASVSRQVSDAIGILYGRSSSGTLGEILFLHIGNNGTFTDGQFDEIMSIADGRRVVIMNVKVPRSWESPNNDVIARGVARYGNAVLVDWYSVSSSNPGILWSDETHLREDSAGYYVQLVLPYIG